MIDVGTILEPCHGIWGCNTDLPTRAFQGSPVLKHMKRYILTSRPRAAMPCFKEQCVISDLINIININPSTSTTWLAIERETKKRQLLTWPILKKHRA
jgi:hypothetical protein